GQAAPASKTTMDIKSSLFSSIISLDPPRSGLALTVDRKTTGRHRCSTQNRAAQKTSQRLQIYLPSVGIRQDANRQSGNWFKHFSHSRSQTRANTRKHEHAN